MDAAPLLFTDLITTPSYRLVIPVYQRPYSWDEEQCAQLWDDILSVGRRQGDKHFTGSVVWIQDGTASASGLTPRLVIDGQQRVTTLMLLFVALAEFARAHPEKELGFSFDEILGAGYLVNPYRKGEDYYKLTLSQGDRHTLFSIIDHLVNPDVEIDASSSRIISNLAFFQKRLEALENPDIVWEGIRRLEIVSVSLTQGQDNPQLIFESMNSTGKDLSSADLIRNYVLMALPLDEQESLYSNYWRKIEETLGSDVYDSIFDDFIRNYLSVLKPSEPLAKRDVYSEFKKYVIDNRYDKEGRIVELLQEIKRYARYYAAIAFGKEPDGALHSCFSGIARLKITVVNPLLLSLYSDYEGGAFSRDDFIAMLHMIESYLLRRSVCNYATNGLNKFFPTLISHLGRVQDEGGDYREALTAFLLNESESARCFPTDAEFRQALVSRNMYRFRHAFYLLSKIENSYHEKDPREFAPGAYTIEHICPQNALAHKEWRDMLGLEEDEEFEALVNSLGNLTLTAYNSELSDGTFFQKKERIVGGYNHEWLVISSDVRNANCWGKGDIDNRASHLADRAIEVWHRPHLEFAVKEKYLQKKKSYFVGRSIQFRQLVAAGLIRPGEELISTSAKYPATATVTSEGRIKLANGEEFNSPSRAHARVRQLAGGASTETNGWHAWKLARDGRIIDDFRSELRALRGDSERGEKSQYNLQFWDEFYERCSDDPGFLEAFGDPSNRYSSKSDSIDFGSGDARFSFQCMIASQKGNAFVRIVCWDASNYGMLLDAKTRMAVSQGPFWKDVEWDSPQKKEKRRTITVKRSFDFEEGDREELYAWMIECLLSLKAFFDAATANSGV